MSYHCSHSSPLGELLLTSDGKSITGLYLDRSQNLPNPDDSPLREPTVLYEARRQLIAYFARELPQFNLPLAPIGTEFQQTVWRELQKIPFGETISYGEQARRLGRPAAVRAVGAANGRNPIPIVIPCHRVIGASGKLVGFGGGIETKRWLIDWEASVAARRNVYSYFSPAPADLRLF